MSKKKIIFRSLTAIVLIAAVAYVTPRLAGYLANSIYKNVDDINDGEMPPTVTSFQSGPEVVSTIGGSGEGLNCSLPPLVNIFFDGSKDANGKRHLVLQRFRQACVFHDLCYRHGLATYGYNQNDCDRVLQNEAFRLCLYIRNGAEAESAARCQTDSKLVLAGVSIGGSDAYRAWNRSTYFEFESDPWRSSGFRASRVVDHPFKSVYPFKYRDDPDQIILTFENARSNLTVTCITCREVPVFGKTRDVSDVSPELQVAGLKSLPEALQRRDGQMLSETTPVWLPPRRHHSAPHLLVDSTGNNYLIWMSRNNPGATVTCIVMADAAKLLTYTLPQRDLCNSDAASQLTMVEVDMFATSPLPVEIPELSVPERIFATGFSALKTADNSLSFCSRSATRTVDSDKFKHDDRAKCHTFAERRVSAGAGLGAFQNFAVVRPGQQIVFVRDIALRSDSLWDRALQRVLGETYSPAGVMLTIDLSATLSAQDQMPSSKEPLTAKLRKPVPFRIDDRFDPMMPITRKKDDLRFLSLETSGQTVGVRMIDFTKNVPTPEHVSLTMNDSEVDLHKTWALRPVLVLETKGADPKTKLVFSRGEIAIDQTKPADIESNTEALSLETLVFERRASDTDKPFVKTVGAACTVTYTFKTNTNFPCYRAFDPQRPMRSSAAAKMQASQLLVGHFAGPDGHGIAFPDFCRPSEPIILAPKGEIFVPTMESVGDEDDFKRTVACDPLSSNEAAAVPIKHKASVRRPDAG